MSPTEWQDPNDRELHLQLALATRKRLGSRTRKQERRQASRELSLANVSQGTTKRTKKRIKGAPKLCSPSNKRSTPHEQTEAAHAERARSASARALPQLTRRRQPPAAHDSGHWHSDAEVQRISVPSATIDLQKTKQRARAGSLAAGAHHSKSAATAVMATAAAECPLCSGSTHRATQWMSPATALVPAIEFPACTKAEAICSQGLTERTV